MRRIAISAVLGLVLFAGCSKSESGNTAAAPQLPSVPPEVAVRDFLEAIRVGDHKKAELMLTDLAREKTAQADLMVAPPGSPTAKFEVSGVQVVDNQVAHVGSVWTDIGDDGKPQTNEFVWALRVEPAGWRIAGVAVELFPNQPPLLLDFEDPADMLRKQQMAEAEMQRQLQPKAAAPGTNPNVAGAAPGAVQPAGGTAPFAANNGFPPAQTATPVSANGATLPATAQEFGNSAPGVFPGSPATALPPGTLQPGTGTTVPLQAEQPNSPLPR